MAMSNISLNITFNNITKKISCSKTITANQLVQLSFDKFKIYESKYIGELKHNGRTLDSSLPLRLTNLSNNSKLVLTIKDIPTDHFVHIKLLVNLPPTNELKTVIAKVNSNLLLIDLIKQFELENSINLLNFEGYKLQLSILNSKVGEEEFNNIKLHSIIGFNITSLVIRLDYLSINNDDKIKEQKEIVELHLRQQRLRNQLKKEQEEKERQMQEERKKESEAIIDIDQVPTNKPLNDEVENELIIADDQPVGQTASISTNEVTRPQVGQVNVSPRLFIPSSSNSAFYENPDDDYEPTLSQVQKYHQLIKNSALPTKNATAPASMPKKYLIRIKFPDRSILQLNFSNADEIKLGNLLKKVDEILLPKFLNNYNLKLGYPPFKKLSLSFNDNNQFLVNLPDFQSERIVLIWESTLVHEKGPFIQTDKINDIKQSNEMPEVALENSRGEIKDESRTLRSTAKKEPNGTKVPKWFKLR